MSTTIEIILKEMKNLVAAARSEMEQKQIEAREKEAVWVSLTKACDALVARAEKP
jgi:hypothetical protein